MAEIRSVDPKTLLLPSAKQDGPDRFRLHRDLVDFGGSQQGMPMVFVEDDPNGLLRIVNGITRATRIALRAPGTPIPVEVMFHWPRPFETRRTVADYLNEAGLI